MNILSDDAYNLEVKSQEILNNNSGFTYKANESYYFVDNLKKRQFDISSEIGFDGEKLTNDLIEICLRSKGWNPIKFKSDGNPSITKDILSELNIKEAELINEYRTIDKIISYSKSWIDNIQPDETINHTCKTIGTKTFRVSHSNPNLGQIPSKGVHGKACRELFSVPDDYFMIGSDLKGIETRLLAHYLFTFDNGNLVRYISEIDIHDSNASILGCDRDTAKTFLYAIIYGATIRKLSAILKSNARAKAAELERILSIDKLKFALVKRFNSQGYIKGLDGRIIFCKLEYKYLNYLLQSAGAIVAKRWMIICREMLDKNGFNDVEQLIFCHDEIQYKVPKKYFDRKNDIGTILRNSAIMAGRYYNLNIDILADVKFGNSWADTH